MLSPSAREHITSSRTIRLPNQPHVYLHQPIIHITRMPSSAVHPRVHHTQFLHIIEWKKVAESRASRDAAVLPIYINLGFATYNFGCQIWRRPVLAFHHLEQVPSFTPTVPNTSDFLINRRGRPKWLLSEVGSAVEFRTVPARRPAKNESGSAAFQLSKG